MYTFSIHNKYIFDEVKKKGNSYFLNVFLEFLRKQ